jgi:hypothetical protein
MFIIFSLISVWFFDDGYIALVLRVHFVCEFDVSRGAKQLHGLKNIKMFFFCRSKAGFALSLVGGERIYPSFRCLACPFGPAAKQVRGSRKTCAQSQSSCLETHRPGLDPRWRIF